MDRFEAMRAVIEAADAGSLSAAARRLRVPLATMSRRVSDLETQIRTQIFVRSNRRLVLTEAGAAYIDACRRILEDLSEAERSAAGEYTAPRGALVVAAPIVFGRLHALPLIVDFLRAYPNVDVRLVQSDRVVDFSEDNVDVAIRIGVLPDSSLVATHVGDVREVVCGSPAYFKKHTAPTSLADLAQHDCITFERGRDGSVWTFSIGKRRVAAPLRIRLAVNTAEAAIDAATAGIGLTRVLSYQTANALKARKLELTLTAFEPAALPVNLIYPQRARMPIKLRAFLDFMAPRLRRRLQQI